MEYSNGVTLANGDGLSAVLPLFMKGKVVKGFRRGSKELGTPTANLDDNVVNQLPLRLPNGIYYGYAQVNNYPVYEAATCIGWNPFYKNEKRTVETHILHEFPCDFYDENLKVVLVGYVRPEMDFSSKEDLIAAIRSDIAITREKLKDPVYSNFRLHDFFSGKSNGILNGKHFESGCEIGDFVAEVKQCV